ncbi:MAG: hypothetical protein ACJ8AS_08640 [Hyphomicrobiales bacterium]
MTNERVRQVLERVLSWPRARQADAVRLLELMEEQDRSQLSLSEEQAAEVRRRLADNDSKTMPVHDFNEHLRRRYGV